MRASPSDINVKKSDPDKVPQSDLIEKCLLEEPSSRVEETIF